MSVSQLPSGVLRFWDRYWFRPAPLFNLAILRIVTVGFQLYHLISGGYALNVVTVSSLPGVSYSPSVLLQVLNAPLPWNVPPTAFVTGVFWAVIVSGVSSLIGFRTRLSLFVFAIGNMYVQSYINAYGKTHHPDAILMITLFILALGPAGKLLSADDLIRRIKANLKRRSFLSFNVLQCESAFARWPLLLVQWLFALVYFSAGLNKIKLSGAGLFSAEWMNGYTLQYYLLRDGVLWGSDLGIWLGGQHVFAVISSWFAVLFELTFCLVLLFPRLALFYVPLGASLHIGIYLAQRAPFFQYLALYPAFVPWTVVLKRLSNRMKWSRPERKASIFYDGLCPVCIRSMTVLCYFDWLQRLNYRGLEVSWPMLSEKHPDITIEECRDQMHFMKPDGSVTKGFFAFREIVKYLPPLWPLVALMYLPGAAFVGQRVYSFVASRRQRFDRCTFDVCSINKPRPS